MPNRRGTQSKDTEPGLEASDASDATGPREHGRSGSEDTDELSPESEQLLTEATDLDAPIQASSDTPASPDGPTLSRGGRASHDIATVTVNRPAKDLDKGASKSEDRGNGPKSDESEESEDRDDTETSAGAGPAQEDARDKEAADGAPTHASPMGRQIKPAADLRPARYRQGTPVGRFVIIAQIGQGGMGAVYSAYDPQLDRRVALKILRTGRTTSEKARARLVREARALAQLSDPHVVQVHDVITHEDNVVIAMEYVDGESLRAFCERTPRPSWREVLAAYIEAARGLAAAHEKGLIHRDIKPANILRAHDGRVRIVDFGLAAVERTNTSAESESSSEEQSAAETGHPTPFDRSGTALTERLTATGVLMGTPAFMPPEQHTGASIGHFADQYSLCASLYEGLYGQLPFGKGKSMGALLRRKLHEQIEPLPADTEVPAWLYQVILRGLRAVPGERFPSMHTLIAALEDDPDLRRQSRIRNVGVSALIAGLAGLAVFGWTQAFDKRSACEELSSELAGTWDPAIKDRISAAFAATQEPHAAETFERFSATVDSYAATWLAMRQETCAATHVQKRQPAEVMGLRVRCLDQRKSQLGALTALFAKGIDKETLQNAGQAALALPSVEYCADVAALTALVPPPEDPALRAKVDALSARLDGIVAMKEAGKYKEAFAQAQAFVKEIGDIDYAHLHARAELEIAVMHALLGDFAAALESYREALPDAGKAKDDVLTARIWIAMFSVTSYELARTEEAVRLLPFMRAAVERADNTEMRGLFLAELALYHHRRGEYDKALPYHEQATAALEEALGPDNERTANAQNNYAVTLGDLGRFADSLAIHEKVRAFYEARLGKNHPILANTYNNIATMLWSLGRYEEALAMHDQALVIYEATLGPSHPNVANSLTNKGAVLDQIGRLVEARAMYERALTIREATIGGDHVDISTTLNNLGVVLYKLGEYEQARDAYARGLAVIEKAVGKDHPTNVNTIANLAVAVSAIGGKDEALRLLEQSYALGEKHVDAKHLNLVFPLIELGNLYRELARYSEAEAAHQRALAIVKDALPPEHPLRAWALTDLGPDLERAGKLDEALAGYREALAIQEKAFSPESFEVSKSLLRQGELLDRMGQLGQARQAIERALSIRQKVRGEGHPDVALARVSLGRILHALGERSAGSAHLRRSLAALQAAFRPEHPAIAEARLALAQVLIDESLDPGGDKALLKGAESLIDKALAARRTLYGAKHPDVAFALAILADARRAAGKLDEARSLYDQALAMAEETAGQDQPLGALILGSLGKVYASQGDYRKALAFHERSRPIIERAHGRQSHVLASSLLASGRALARLGRHKDAQADIQAALDLRRSIFGAEHAAVAEAEAALAEIRE